MLVPVTNALYFPLEALVLENLRQPFDDLQ